MIACLLACLINYLLTYLLTYLLSYLLTYYVLTAKRQDFFLNLYHEGELLIHFKESTCSFAGYLQIELFYTPLPSPFFFFFFFFFLQRFMGRMFECNNHCDKFYSSSSVIEVILFVQTER